MKREAPVDVLQGYMKAVHDSILAPLMKIQGKLAFQNELRISKRFLETDAKIKDYLVAYELLKENFALRDNVIDALRKIHAARQANRIAQYLEKQKDAPLEEVDEVKAALAPYIDILHPAEDIRKLQTTVMNQGRIKKMTLPYEEITNTFNEVTAMAAKMPAILTDGIYSLSEQLDQVA